MTVSGPMHYVYMIVYYAQPPFTVYECALDAANYGKCVCT